jgi:hypothetical protein
MKGKWQAKIEVNLAMIKAKSRKTYRLLISNFSINL